MKKLLISFVVLAAFVACKSNTPAPVATSQVETHVLHKGDVAPLSPDSVLAILKIGNKNFAEKHATDRDIVAQMVESAEDGQNPLAIVLSCIDSRVPVEMIFDKGLGDLFVARVAGNIVNQDMLGSMEYACEHSGSKVVVVLGHESCGAVHSACEGVTAGNMGPMLSNISPAIESVKESDGGDPHSHEFQEKVVKQNVINMVARVRNESEILAHLESEGKIKIVGAIFNLHTGAVNFL